MHMRPYSYPVHPMCDALGYPLPHPGDMFEDQMRLAEMNAWAGKTSTERTSSSGHQSHAEKQMSVEELKMQAKIKSRENGWQVSTAENVRSPRRYTNRSRGRLSMLAV